MKKLHLLFPIFYFSIFCFIQPSFAATGRLMNQGTQVISASIYFSDIDSQYVHISSSHPISGAYISIKPGSPKLYTIDTRNIHDTVTIRFYNSLCNSQNKYCCEWQFIHDSGSTPFPPIPSTTNNNQFCNTSGYDLIDK